MTEDQSTNINTKSDRLTLAELPPELETFSLRFFGLKSFEVFRMTSDGSEKKYYRLMSNNSSVILCNHKNVEANERYIKMSSLLSKKLSVPRILSYDKNLCAYIMSDIGDITLEKALSNSTEESKLDLAKVGINILLQFHEVTSSHKQDLIPLFHDHWREEDMLSYFTGNFFEAFPQLFEDFQEALLELKEVTEYCSSLGTTGFAMGDFQPRNLMLKEGKMYLIDFQDTKKGNILYDLASFLISGGAFLKKISLLEQCLEYFENKAKISFYDDFRKAFWGYVLLRRLRSLGTYVRLGIRQGNPAFAGKLLTGTETLVDLLNYIGAWYQLDITTVFLQKAIKEIKTIKIN